MSTQESPKRTIWVHPDDPACIQIIDQRQLPHELVIADLRTAEEVARAIKQMWVRGAPLIGGTAAYGFYLAVREAAEKVDPEGYLLAAEQMLLQTRPTAVNLAWAIGKCREVVDAIDNWPGKIRAAFEEAGRIIEEDVASCRSIAEHGLPLIKAIHQITGKPVQVLTHCNAGRLATIEWGTATAAVYLAHQQGIPVHVWVDETRPRNQGARLTAWELADAGVPHTIITDNVGGHLMQHGEVDICFVGSDRTTATGDVANKIGTYLKALAAHDNGVPFYVALPSSTIDFQLKDGLKEIPIEERGAEEVTHMRGWSEERTSVEEVRLTPAMSPAANYAFDVTPARLVSGLITERGICDASEEGIKGLFVDMVE